MFVAIDRTSKFAFVKLEAKANRVTASAFLEDLIEAVPYKIHTILTDNGIPFHLTVGPWMVVSRCSIPFSRQRMSNICVMYRAVGPSL